MTEVKGVNIDCSCLQKKK